MRTGRLRLRRRRDAADDGRGDRGGEAGLEWASQLQHGKPDDDLPD